MEELHHLAGYFKKVKWFSEPYQSCGALKQLLGKLPPFLAQVLCHLSRILGVKIAQGTCLFPLSPE